MQTAWRSKWLAHATWNLSSASRWPEPQSPGVNYSLNSDNFKFSVVTSLVAIVDKPLSPSGSSTARKFILSSGRGSLTMRSVARSSSSCESPASTSTPGCVANRLGISSVDTCKSVSNKAKACSCDDACGVGSSGTVASNEALVAAAAGRVAAQVVPPYGVIGKVHPSIAVAIRCERTTASDKLLLPDCKVARINGAAVVVVAPERRRTEGHLRLIMVVIRLRTLD